MKTGIINTAYTSVYGSEQGYRRMKLHGYDCADFQGFINTETELFRSDIRSFEAALCEERKIAEAAGISFSQAHGPWRHPPRDFSDEDRAERFEAMKKSIYGTAVLGCKNWVIHPIMPFGSNSPEQPERMWELNREFFSQISDYAKELGITVCFENMPFTHLPLSSVEQIVRFVKELSRDNFRICLDTGHCAVFGQSPADAVRMIGSDLLTVLHIHDNDGKRDIHQKPGEGVIDWRAFSASLKEIGFGGVLSLECTPAKADEPSEEREEKEIALANIAKRLSVEAE